MKYELQIARKEREAKLHPEERMEISGWENLRMEEKYFSAVSRMLENKELGKELYVQRKFAYSRLQSLSE